MSSYNNKNNTLTKFGSNVRMLNTPMEQYVTEGELVEGLATKQDILQYDVLPTASSENLGKIVQYVGTTNADYQNGEWYECISNGELPPTYSWLKYNSDYPYYVEAEKEKVLAKVKDLQAQIATPTTIGFSTDQHMNHKDIRHINAILPALRSMRDLTKELPFTICVLGGDTNGSTDIVDILQDNKMVTEAIDDGAQCPVVHITGNHDIRGNNANIRAGQLFYAKMTDAVRNHICTVTDDSNNCYYDDAISNIRFIMLNDDWALGWNSANHVTKNFLVSALSSLGDYQAAVIFSHHPLGNLTDTPHVRPDDWNEPLMWGDIVAPYKDKIIACICGHVHCDKSEILDGILYLSTTCAGRQELNDGSTRIDGQADVTAYDVMVIDRKNYQIHCVRYGNGQDRNIAYYVPTYTNVLPTAIDSDGTIFNGVGYMNGKCLNSSGNVVSAGEDSSVSGFIPINHGDVIRIRGAYMSKLAETIINYIVFYNSTFTPTYIGQASYWWEHKSSTSSHVIQQMEADGDNVIEFTVPPSTDFDGGYLRISCQLLDNAVITINESIPIK